MHVSNKRFQFQWYFVASFFVITSILGGVCAYEFIFVRIRAYVYQVAQKKKTVVGFVGPGIRDKLSMNILTYMNGQRNYVVIPGKPAKSKNWRCTAGSSSALGKETNCIRRSANPDVQSSTTREISGCDTP